MSVWSDLLRTLQQAALMQDKVERALTAAEQAQAHSQENRERIIAIETTLNVAMSRASREKRLPSR